MSEKHVYIIHGYGASPQHHWFPWLKEKLEARGISVSVLPMPDTANPDPAAWDQFLNKQVASHDENTFFVAHSLGGISLLRHLMSVSKSARIGGLVLVSGFSKPLPGLPEIDGFTAGGFDPEHITRIAPRRAVFASQNDPIVPLALTKQLSQELDAPFYSIADGGHFLGIDGFLEFPEVYRELEKMLSE